MQNSLHRRGQPNKKVLITNPATVVFPLNSVNSEGDDSRITLLQPGQISATNKAFSGHRNKFLASQERM